MKGDGTMTTDPIDLAINKVRESLSSPPLSIVRYDKNSQKITVKYDFNDGRIQNVKLIATREQWLLLSDFDPEQIIFGTIACFLSRPSKKLVRELQEYASNNLYWFVGDVLFCINQANQKNPLYYPARSPRGGSPYFKSIYDMNQLRQTARHLYIYLRYNLNKKNDVSNPKLDRLLKAHGIDKHKDMDVREITLIIIQKAFNWKLDSHADYVYPYEMFYRKYISLPGQTLKRISNLKSIQSGNSHLLKKIFSNL